jgi:outer membrane lipoprotein SlyB
MIFVAAIGISLLAAAGCETAAQTGAAVGVLAGAGIGQAVGGTAGATIAGAAIGGAAGYMVGNEEDKMEARARHVRIHEEMDFVVVNVTNSNGSISRVRLWREGPGFVGTRGEYYNHLPTQDELRPIYGF